MTSIQLDSLRQILKRPRYGKAVMNARLQLEMPLTRGNPGFQFKPSLFLLERE